MLGPFGLLFGFSVHGLDEEPGGDALGGDAALVLPAPTGLQCYDQAPLRASKPAMCWTCHIAIPKGSWRFDYRFKASRSWSDQRRVHLACLGLLNKATYATDVAMMRRWMADASKPDEERLVLAEAFACLTKSGGEASSGGAAVPGSRPGSSGDA